MPVSTPLVSPEVHASAALETPVAAPASTPNVEVPVGAPQASGPVVGADGKVDVTAIYQRASLPTVKFTAEQAYESLHQLPAELPLEVRRQTFKVILTGVGTTPNAVVEDAARKAAAMHSFIEGMSKQSDAFVAHLESEIQSLQAKIEEARGNITRAKGSIEALTSGCTQEAEKLNEVAEFFSTGAPASKTPPG